MTRQRQVIIEELRNVSSHPTADEVYRRARTRLPRISLGTVYRNLETLSKSGIVQKLELGGAQKRFDFHCEDHYHLLCTNCGRLDDIKAKPIPDIEDLFHNASGYQITGHQLMLIGLCPDCSRKKSKDK
jgi:Fur family ferric uptake transcriptional regulator